MPARAALLLTALIVSTSVEAAPRAGQLPPGVVPIHYDIAVDPDARALAFTGQETITVSVAMPVRRLVLNAADLTIGGVRVDGRAARWAIDAKAQRLTIIPAAGLGRGIHRIAIGWSGTISQSSAGLFAIDYQDARGAQRMLATQFEPSDARRFAPMWDEPASKATFTLTTTAPAGQTAFSNMPVATRADGPGGKRRFTFQPTPKISSYLVFLGIGDVERRTVQAGKTEIGVITRRGAADQGAYALASAKRLLAYYNDYFGTPYPLPKLDMVAAPGSSQIYGAMENWGAIFYFERAILIDPALSTESNRQRVFTTVAHEMAHQWFGDLVTMAWWDDLWLNEGFAEWMDGKATADLNPDWKLDAQLIAGARQSAFQADSRRGTHPIVQRIDTPEQANQAFDSITYLKGEAVIRMLEGAVGKAAFRNGVRRYMAAHPYANTVTDDLWNAIAIAAGRPVKPLMDAFTRKEGVPLIRVGEPACDAGQTRLVLRQERYGTDASGQVPQTWPVPVALAGGSTVQRDVSGPAPTPVTVAGCAPVVVNPGQYGYYRTLYARGHLDALARGFGGLALDDQIGTLLDRFALADAGYAPLDDALGLLGQIPPGADPLVWSAIANQIAGYDTLLRDDPARPAFRARATALLAPQLARVGFAVRPGEAPPVTQLRETVVATMGALGDGGVVAEARRRVAGGMENIPAAIRQPMVTIFAENASVADWEMLHAAARRATNPLVRQSLYKDLGRAEDETLTRRALAIALTDEAPVPLRADLIAAAAERHPALVFDWAVAHGDAVNALVEPAARQQVIPGLAATAADDATADRLEAYVARAIPIEGRRAAAAAIGQIRYGARVKARVRAPLAAWADAR